MLKRRDDKAVTASKVAQLAETKTLAEIAEILDWDEEEVATALEQSGRKMSSWVVSCTKTGRWWKARTERGAYRLAQLKGLTDYTTYQEGKRA